MQTQAIPRSATTTRQRARRRFSAGSMNRTARPGVASAQSPPCGRSGAAPIYDAPRPLARIHSPPPRRPGPSAACRRRPEPAPAPSRHPPRHRLRRPRRPPVCRLLLVQQQPRRHLCSPACRRRIRDRRGPPAGARRQRHRSGHGSPRSQGRVRPAPRCEGFKRPFHGRCHSATRALQCASAAAAHARQARSGARNRVRAGPRRAGTKG